MPLNFFQRLLKEEVKGVVIRQMHSWRGPLSQEVTTYEVQGEDGRIHLGAIRGHLQSPYDGDSIKMSIKRFGYFVEGSGLAPKQLKDGSIEYSWEETILYKEITNITKTN